MINILMLSKLQNFFIRCRILSIPDDLVDGCSFAPFRVWERLTNKQIKVTNVREIHDALYWKGGTEKDRKFADNILKRQVKQNWSSTWSFLMYFGIRLCGWMFFNYHCNLEFYESRKK